MSAASRHIIYCKFAVSGEGSMSAASRHIIYCTFAVSGEGSMSAVSRHIRNSSRSVHIQQTLIW